MEHFKEYSDNLERALLTLDRVAAETIIGNCFSAENRYSNGGEIISHTLMQIGKLWENGNLALSQVYTSGLICEEAMDKILPSVMKYNKKQPVIAIGVYEDHHLLGKRIILSALRSSGYQVADLGGGLHDDALLKSVTKQKIKILLLSVLMLPSALHIKNLKLKLKDSGVILVVGGAPFRLDKELWKEVNADYTGKDSAEAIELVTNLVKELS